MIPKIIHYCWFGRAPKPKLALKCIESWKKYCPDYRIIEWNEDNYDLISAPLFVKQAIEAQKWAFATDFIRLKVVYDYGGIYFDTDVELIRNIDTFLNNKSFFGFENEDYVGTGLGFGSEKCETILLELMETYCNTSFQRADGSYDLSFNAKRDKSVFEQHGLIFNGKEQILDGGIHIYSDEYFCPYKLEKLFPHKTRKTVAIHWYMSSWCSLEDKRKIKRKKVKYILHFPKRIARNVLGTERYELIKSKLKRKNGVKG